MKILELEYEDKTTGWKLENTKFDDFNLLVGLSGVGKTKILNSINSIGYISVGISVNGAKWKIKFLDNSQNEYIWKGEFENISENKYLLFRLESSPKPKILSEELRRNGKIIIKRSKKQILFRDKRTLKLPSEQSAIFVLKEEDLISPVFISWLHIVKDDFSQKAVNLSNLHKFDILREMNLSLDGIKGSNLDTRLKTALIYIKFPKVFKDLKNSFIEIFPSITDVKIETHENVPMPNAHGIAPELQIKEKETIEWISVESISSGMYKSFFMISELFLAIDGTVILMDEFENSLGLNCIDVLTEILQNKRNIQFIITSHHPYIINNISPKYWKIVTRKGSVVSVKDVDEKLFARSHHEAFIKLLNLKEYREGIAA